MLLQNVSSSDVRIQIHDWQKAMKHTELQSQCLSPVAGTTNTHHHSWYCCVLFFIIIMCFIITLNQNLHVLITLKFIFFICKIVPLSLLKSQINMKKLQLLAKHHKKWEVISTH